MNPVIPKEIPLALPAPVWLLTTLLLVSFALHILFVNLMVGGSIMVLFTEFLGRRNRDWDRISLAIAKTITVNKSLAVVLGVAPLLTISVLYTMHFYTANLLTGTMWLMIVPLITAAFLLAYAHKYSWSRLEHARGIHLGLAAASTALFLFIPIVFLTNINLMLYPERWGEVSTFWSAATLPNVLPRYLHFLAATVSVMALFLAKYLSRERFFAKLGLETMTREEVTRSFYGVAFLSTGLQLLFGPVLFFTLPSHTVSWTIILILLIVVVPFAALAIWWVWREMHSERPGVRFWHVVTVLSVVVSFMVYVRHDIRERAIAPYRTQAAAATTAYMADVKAAQNYLVIPGGLGGKPVSPGELLFQRKCASCHALESRLVGPPLTETAAVYKGNPDGIVDWTLNPGRKRMDYPPMPVQEMPRADLLLIANYILETTANR